MYCKGDPRIADFYHKRRALTEVTAKLKFRGEEKNGLPENAVANINKQTTRIGTIKEIEEKENAGELVRPRGKKRHSASADRDLTFSGLILSPRKKRSVAM